MNRIVFLLYLVFVTGCAVSSNLASGYAALDRLGADDGWRARIKECGTVIGTCGSVSW